MNRATINVGDVVAFATEPRGARLFQVCGAPGIPQGPMERIMVRHEDEQADYIGISSVRHHWVPAKPESRKRGPLAGPRKRDELVITKIEMALCKPNPRARLKAMARVLVSDQIWLDGFAVFDNMEVQMPEGVRLTIPTGKTWLKWRNAIVLEYMKLTGAKA